MTIKTRERFNFTLLFNILYLSDAPWCVSTFVWFLCLSIGRTVVRPYVCLVPLSVYRTHQGAS
ncbi:MAG: hypothetical protein K2M39_11020, partial [Muribaculaceae bacterium]|nr:hypothetical protein [Muribaculaceae bacterium]